MRKMSLCLAILLVAAGSYAGSRQKTDKPTQKDRVCIEWLLERMAEAKSIEVGMSLEDILTVYELRGGVQFIELDEPFSGSIHHGWFILRKCRYIHLEVEFEIPEGINPPEASHKDVKIKKLSRPYLEYDIAD